MKIDEKCGGFTKKAENRNIHAREIAKHDFSPACVNFLYSYRNSRNAFYIPIFQ